MSRHIASLLRPLAVAGALSAACAAGCDRSPPRTWSDDRSVEHAIENSREEAELAQAAEAARARETAAARAQFEKSKEDYRQVRTDDLNGVDKQIADLHARERASHGRAKGSLALRLPAIRAQRDTFARSLQALDQTTAETWDEAKANVDRDWDSLKAALDQAR